MRAGRLLVACLVMALPLSGWATSYKGVIGTRLINDGKPTGGSDLYLGLINTTASHLDISLRKSQQPDRGFQVYEMPSTVPPGSRPTLADPASDYARQNPILSDTQLAFANFPQPGQGHFRFRRDLNISAEPGSFPVAIWDIPREANITYHLSPQGFGAGSGSGVDLTITTGYELRGFDLGNALEQLGKTIGGAVGLTAGVTGYYGARTAYQMGWSALRQAYAENPAAVRRVFAHVVAHSARIAGVAMLQGEVLYWYFMSSTGRATLLYSTSAYARLGGEGVTQEVQNPLEQKVLSPDRRFEYTLNTVTLPYATDAKSYNVPNTDDALLVLGVRRVLSAERTCTELAVDAEHSDDMMLKGRCRYWEHGREKWKQNSLELNLCRADGDVFNEHGVLDCSSRFSGPFEQQFHKYDGNLSGSYRYVDGVLEVYSAQNPPTVQASLRDAEQCQPGTITFGPLRHRVGTATYPTGQSGLFCVYR